MWVYITKYDVPVVLWQDDSLSASVFCYFVGGCFCGLRTILAAYIYNTMRLLILNPHNHEAIVNMHDLGGNMEMPLFVISLVVDRLRFSLRYIYRLRVRLYECEHSSLI